MRYELMTDLYKKHGSFVVLQCIDALDSKVVQAGQAIRAKFGYNETCLSAEFTKRATPDGLAALEFSLLMQDCDATLTEAAHEIYSRLCDGEPFTLEVWFELVRERLLLQSKVAVQEDAGFVSALPC